MPTILPENDFSDDGFKEVDFKIGKEIYKVREADGDASYKYRNKIIGCTELGADGQAKSVKDIADVEPFLISMCLFDAAGKLVPATTIRKFKATVCKRLYELIKEISELDDGTTDDIAGLEKQLASVKEKLDKAKAKEDAPKNEPSNSTTGSE